MSLLLDREFLRTLEQLTLLSREGFSGAMGIDHRSRNRGSGLEFADYRRYSYGDDPRFLDWNVYLRLGKLFLKLYQIEEQIPVRVLLDCSASMAFGEGAEEKFAYAQRLAAVFSFVALLHLDTAAIVPFAEHMAKPIVAAGGRDRFWPIAHFINELRCAGRTDIVRSVKDFLGHFTSRGVVVLISDFFDDDGCERAVNMLRFAGHDFVLVHLHTAEEQRPREHGELLLEDIESGTRQPIDCSPESAAAYEAAFEEFSQRLRRLAVRNGGRYVRAATSVPYQAFVLDGLRSDQVLA